MPDVPKLPEHEPPEPELPHGLPMPANTSDIPPPKLPPAPEDDPSPPGKEPKPDIDEVRGL